jgi:hypothetical protein
MYKKIAIIVLIHLMIITVFSVEVKKIKIQGFDEFKKGTLKNITLNAAGILMIGPETRQLNSPEDDFFLSFTSDENKNLFVGTGHEGMVFKIPKGQGKPERMFKSDELDIYALTVLRSGELLIGSSPSGKVYKISRDKKKSIFFNPRERMIWDIVEDQSRNIFCAVGVQGAVYKLTQNGTGRKILGIDDFHILSLFVTKDNRLIIGSGENGILFEYKNNKTRVLYDTPYSEIKGICEDETGNLYFSATSAGFVSNLTKVLNSGLSKSSKDILIKKPKIKPVFYRSVLYKMDSSGVVEQIWKLKNEYIYDLAWDKQNNGIIVATGNSGRIYRVNPNGEYTMLYEGDFSQAYKLIAGGDNLYMVSNNSAAILKMDYTPAQKGEYYSRIYDMKVKSLIGKIYWNRGYKSTKGLNIFIRMGNASNPDVSWTEWAVPFSDQSNSKVNISGFRYFQIKAVFNDLNLNTSLQLHNIFVYYRQSNIRPKIKRITIKPGIKEKANLLQVRWVAEDRNSDRLNYTVSMKKVGEKKWIRLSVGYTKKELIINPRMFEDGIYHLKIRVDDIKDNPGEGKFNDRISEPFYIDSTAPVIKNYIRAAGTVKFKVIDMVSTVYKVQYSFDRKNWFSVFPLDKINDSEQESFSLKVPANKTYLFIKVMDEALNEKVLQKAL